ncbi:multi-sensor signal transduction histidine kinase [Arcobacter nitrofigilis DSM 7299]|uniref:histidine kinase n=1 Tax=Arcobacter nitrofigilis (strain ATCC 33309 / DSM 7299 / CCUG 15893 / LMG 7604 / NCTC 12251 / CI) TaxID=572480 RepID=D5V169_ARCNC|nr:cache domain-containing protein [Arcobacter nitrofigilis]ADG94031.1 multi-sensor signal transduction histidine kinase [Arcobacter nitrofigilis DSM 7299]
MEKQNNYIFEIIFLPIIIIIFLITSITIFNIHSTKKQLENQIKNKKAEFFQEKKNLIYNKVHNINNFIKMDNNKVNTKVKNQLKEKIETALKITKNIYKKNKNLSKKSLIKVLKNRLSFLTYNKNENYYFIFDKEGNILAHPEKDLLGKNLNDYYDTDNIKIGSKLIKSLSNNEKIGFTQYHFKKPNIKNKVFLKAIAVMYFKPLDIYIGTLVYPNEILNEQKEDLVKRIELSSDLKEYILLFNVFNIKGGKGFAQLIASNNEEKYFEKKLDDDIKDEKGNYYRKDVLKLLRKNGECYYKYWFKKPGSNVEKERYAYFYWNKQWNWIITSGFYFEDLDAQIDKLKNETDSYLSELIINSLIWGLIFCLVMISISTTIFYKIQRRINNNQVRLIKSQENLKKAQKISKVGSWSYSYETEDLILSDETYELFGIEKDKRRISSKYLLSFVHSDDKRRVNVLLDRLVKEKKAYEIIHRLVINNKIKWVNNQCEVFVEKNGMIIVGTLQDITEKYEKDKKIEEQSQLLFNQSKMAAMGEMIENIAHQWRQPLSAISISASGLKLESEYKVLDNNKIEETLTNILDNTKYLSNTIDDFRKYFVKDKNLAKCNIKEVYKNTIKLLKPKFDTLNIEIKDEECEDLFTYTLENELVQCLMNIFNNAHDALVKNKTDKKYILIKISKKYDNIIIDIRDNAGGIDNNIIQKVFEPYFTTKHKSQGTGIGLYMTQEIVIKHLKGFIKVENVKYEIDGIIYKGASFKISLPQELKK